MSNQNTKIFVISGPAGVGQGTIIKELLKKPELNLQWVKGYTSRAPRESDLREQKYTFITKEEFQHLAKDGEIFEWTFFNNHYYGSSKLEIKKILENSQNAIRDVDPIDGRKAYRKLYPGAVLIFITADLASIRKRLINRGQNTLEEIEDRLKIAEEEIKQIKYYDYVVENPDGHPEKAVEEIKNIMKKELEDEK
jgi:guanylate kinase